jgi:spore coat polysaccharide biosynthesis protein SpsF
MINKSEIGVLIAVRMKSSRLGSKAMEHIIGRPMVVHLIERLKRVRNVEKIVLCTSTNVQDKVLLEVAKQEGILSFAGSELDVMKRFIDAAELYCLKHVVRVTGDNPLTDPENIDRLIEEHIAGNFEFSKSEYLPLGVNAEVISVDTLKKAYATAEDTSLTEYMTTYLKRPDYFRILTLKQVDSFFEGKAQIRLTVDYEEDLKVMNLIYRALYPQNSDFTIKDVCSYLNNHPEIMQINADVKMIPLPQIYFKGEKKYNSKLIIIGSDTGNNFTNIVKKIRALDQYDIIGFIQDGGDFQYSLSEGVPTMGLISKIDQIDLNASHFISIIKDENRSAEINELLTLKGLKRVYL